MLGGALHGLFNAYGGSLELVPHQVAREFPEGAVGEGLRN
jgi:hypothetical protein